MRAEAILSFFGRARNSAKDNPKEMKELEELEADKKFFGEEEYVRNSNVFLTSEKVPSGTRGNHVLLVFELDQRKPNWRNTCLALPKLNLEHLVEIGTKKEFLQQVKKVIANIHGEKYKNIPVYEI